MKSVAIVVHYGETTPTSRLAARLHDLEVPFTIVWNEPARAVPKALAKFDIARPKENLGFGGGANFGADHAEESHPDLDAFWILNHDALPNENTLPILEAALESDPSLAMVGPRLLDPRGRIWHDGGEIVWPDARVRTENFGAEPKEPESGPIDTGFVCGCAPLIRRSAFESVGGFDPSWFLYFEDVDLSDRLRDAGHRIAHVPSAVCEHVGGAATESKRQVAIENRLRNRLRYIRERAPDDTVRREGLIQVGKWARKQVTRYFWTFRPSLARAISRALSEDAPTKPSAG